MLLVSFWVSNHKNRCNWPYFLRKMSTILACICSQTWHQTSRIEQNIISIMKFSLAFRITPILNQSNIPETVACAHWKCVNFYLFFNSLCAIWYLLEIVQFIPMVISFHIAMFILGKRQFPLFTLQWLTTGKKVIATNSQNQYLNNHISNIEISFASYHPHQTESLIIADDETIE